VIHIKNINISEIEIYKNEAKKAGLVFCKNTIYYGLYNDNELLAFTGILFYKNKAIFKNHYVPEENRGKGYFKILFDFSIKICKELNINIVEATCTNMSIKEYYKRGFIDIKKYKYYTKVKNENI
jgi:hypothetical protein